MNVLIVYETKYGNTKKAAETIGEVIEEGGNEVKVVKVDEVNQDILPNFELFIIGSPTNAGSHTASIKKFITSLSDQNLEGKQVVVFDTHIGPGGEKSGGGLLKKAVKKMEKQIQQKTPKLKKLTNGLQVAVAGMKGPLVDGELERCKEFGKTILSKLKN